ncbi:MAG: prepilin-type N-terminal cleavage/methylation domain-containing protein [Pseudomonadales bacterium]
MKAVSRAKQTFQSGFSLLEVLLSLALASAILLAASQLLQALVHRASWWQLLSQMVVTRQAVVRSIANLGDQVCQTGILQGDKSQWRWHLQQSGSCQIYDMRLQASQQQLQKRRLGGRYTSFIDSIAALQVIYGVTGEDDCVVRQWLAHVDHSQGQQAVMLHLRFAVGIQGQAPEYALPVGWYVDKSNGQEKLWQPTEVVLSLPCNRPISSGLE